jgi:hypothetical protein
MRGETPGDSGCWVKMRMTKAECAGWQNNSRLVAIFEGGGDSNLPSFGQLQGQPPGFEVGASGIPLLYITYKYKIYSIPKQCYTIIVNRLSRLKRVLLWKICWFSGFNVENFVARKQQNRDRCQILSFAI